MKIPDLVNNAPDEQRMNDLQTRRKAIELAQKMEMDSYQKKNRAERRRIKNQFGVMIPGSNKPVRN